MKKCYARTMKGQGAFGTPHVCHLLKGHKGKHRCGKKLGGSLYDPMNKSCNFRWGKNP